MARKILFDGGPVAGGTAFLRPERILRADTPDQIPDILRALEAARAQGLWAAGYASYEAGHALDPHLAPLIGAQRPEPLMLFGLFAGPTPAAPYFARAARLAGNARLSPPRPLWNAERHAAAILRLQDYIAAGDIYQANLTFPLSADYSGGPLSLYGALRARQAVPYGAFVDLGGPLILSRSPELFFRIDASGCIETRPMKGTQPRGATPEQDAERAEWLRGDIKNRAENLMIVDLLRNDLARVATLGSVRVPELFHVEPFATVHQMTSRITADLRRGVTVADLFAALFPCGSVTGAPKIRAMEIIAELEDTPRGAYCGAIGWIAPDGRMEFNVAIRTLILDRRGKARLNVGGGVVWDSTAAGEYEEALWKTRFALI